MAWVYEIATEYNFPNITVYRKVNDGVQSGWRVETNEGYVMYDPNDPQIGYDEDDNEIEVFYYYTVKILTLNYNFDNFPWVAVPRDSVDENYIFGVGNNDHEIM
jgi:hypothetical protein